MAGQMLMYTYVTGLISRICKKFIPHDQTYVDESYSEHIEFILVTIDKIGQLMPDDSTSNHWRGHFWKMKEELIGSPNRHGINKAKRIWDSMHGGMGSWNDYYIPHAEQNVMTRLNEELQKHCALLSRNLECVQQHD